MSEKKSTRRYRIFATVVYPESAIPDWQEILVQCFIPAFISPLHDHDKNPTGEDKKPHYHVLLMYDAPHSLDQAREIFQQISGVGCEVVQSVRGYARYLCHLDNPEKHQYCTDDVRQICGADYASVIGLATDKYKALREMTEWCLENGVYLFSDLWEYAMQERMDWFRILCDCGTIPIKEWMKSKTYGFDRWRQEENV